MENPAPDEPTGTGLSWFSGATIPGNLLVEIGDKLAVQRLGVERLA
jgi:hypothetical protein